MENVVTYLLGWADKKFIPDSLREHLDEYYRARMLVMVCIVSSSVLTPFIFVRFWLQGPQLFSITMGILVSLVLLTPAVLRIKKSIAYAGMFLVTTATTCLLLMAYNDGGLRSPTIFALLLAPVFAVFLETLCMESSRLFLSQYQ